ncbi:MAG TPA: MMPL family transporter, partial [Gemmataceae bacterium]|nr:MMPL family transporter [Gemmataceae bacterium]
MFPLLGKTVARFWPLLLAAWIIVLAVEWQFAPAWDAVAQSGDASFLPENAPSRRGEELFKKAFPDGYAGSSIVLVLAREQNSAGLGEQDQKFIAQVLTPALKAIAQEAGDGGSDVEPVIARIRTPEEPGVGALLLSRDKKAALVLVELRTRYLDQRNSPALEKVERLISRLRQENKVPDGLEIAVTGSATAGRDMLQAEQKSAHNIERWTFFVVVALLLLAYRAPLVALIPLVTVAVAVEVALMLLALLAEVHVLVPSREIRIFITVIAYGAGVDYCVFLIDRYREELDAGFTASEAAARAIGHAGGAVSASAATVICGIGMMAFAQFGKIREAGYVIPFCLIIVLCAALTFAPALLRLTGRWVFWPIGQVGPTGEERGRGPMTRFLNRLFQPNFMPDFWSRIGPALARRPGLIWLTTVAVMAPFAVLAVLFYDKINYDP